MDRKIDFGVYGDTNCRDHDVQATIVFSSRQELMEKCVQLGRQHTGDLADTESFLISGKCYNTSSDGYSTVQGFADECVNLIRAHLAN